jgi:hypothetical protein
MAKKLNLMAVLPPPWISLDTFYNDDKELSKDLFWDEYFDLTKITNLVQKKYFSV